MKSKWIWATVLIAALLTAGFFYSKYRIAPKVKFEGLALTDLNGNVVSIDKVNGKKLFVNFMATWCGPCISELPSLEIAQQTLRAEDFQFLLVSDEPLERLKQLQQKVNLPVLHSTTKLTELKIYTIPTSYLLNGKGEIIFKKTGGMNWASEETLNELRVAK